MSDYKAILKEQMIKYGFTAPDMTVTEFVEDIVPSAEPERKKGKWMPFDKPWYQCSECGAVRENNSFMENFCPNCGARMEK